MEKTTNIFFFLIVKFNFFFPYLENLLVLHIRAHAHTHTQNAILGWGKSKREEVHGSM